MRTPQTLLIVFAMVWSACGSGDSELSLDEKADQAFEDVCNSTINELLPENRFAKWALEVLVKFSGVCDGEKAAKREGRIIHLMVRLEQLGLLDNAISMMIDTASLAGQLPGVSPEQKEDYKRLLFGLLDAEFCLRGLFKECKSNADRYKTWEQLQHDHIGAIEADWVLNPRSGFEIPLSDPMRQQQLADMSGAQIMEGNQVELLVDGPASYNMRDEMLANAKSSIYLMSWAIYDDQTGRDTANMLVKRANEGLDVRVIIDGKQSLQQGFTDVVTDMLEGSAVKVMRWNDKRRERQPDGTHRKLFVVDGIQAIAGGMNIGDVYALRHTHATGGGFRDTDIGLCGPVVAQASALFQKVWNQVQPSDSFPADTAQMSCTMESAADKRVAITDHVPNDDENIMLTTLQSMQAAKNTIDIEHGYFISTPGLELVLAAALRRGVQVRIYTNGLEALDGADAVLGPPIFDGLPSLIDAGAEVWVRKNSQLHSKWITIDDEYTAVGSYNLHPRSYRVEGELIVQVMDPAFAKHTREVFEADIKSAGTSQITAQEARDAMPESLIVFLTLRWFFNTL